MALTFPRLRRELDREAALREDAIKAAVQAEDEGRFQHIARGVYDEAKAEGKNVVPIEKAMFAKSITLLPASCSMRI